LAGMGLCRREHHLGGVELLCNTGIYRIVPHPVYLGNIITAIGIPLVLGSLWIYLPVFRTLILTLVRTSLEDRTLRNDLEGYGEYAERTRYRLLPGSC